MTVIEAAVENAYDSLPIDEFNEQEYSYIVLEKGEETLITTDDDEYTYGAGWLKDMLVKAEIIDIEPEESK